MPVPFFVEQKQEKRKDVNHVYHVVVKERHTLNREYRTWVI